MNNPMNITWDTEPHTSDQLTAVEYLRNSEGLAMAVLKLIVTHGLLTASFTPKPTGEKFFTYEIRHDPLRTSHHLIVWRGIRVGDAVPVLYGVLEDEASG